MYSEMPGIRSGTRECTVTGLCHQQLYYRELLINCCVEGHNKHNSSLIVFCCGKIRHCFSYPPALNSIAAYTTRFLINNPVKNITQKKRCIKVFLWCVAS